MMQGKTGLAAMLLGLYAAQSVTGSMVQTALPVVLREAGMSLDRIGFLSLLFLPWVFKLFWAPLVDRFATPRRWILGCQAALACCFLLAAAWSPVTHLAALTPVLFAMAVIAATQDIATDAAGIHATTSGTRVLASGASTVGGYLGFLLGGGVWLWVYAASGWAVSMLILAGAMLVLALPVTQLRLPARPQAERVSLRRITRRIMGNRALMAGIGFLILWQCGIRLASAMAGPMLVDAGLNLEEIAWLRGAGGMVVGLAAAVAGTLAVRRFGKFRVLILAGLAMVAALVGLIWWSLTPGPVALLAALQIALMSATAVSFVALYAAMMDWCSEGQAATDFALLQSLDAAIAVVTGIFAGQLAAAWGYAPVFALAALFLLIAFPLSRSRLDRAAPRTEPGPAAPLTPTPATDL